MKSIIKVVFHYITVNIFGEYCCNKRDIWNDTWFHYFYIFGFNLTFLITLIKFKSLVICDYMNICSTLILFSQKHVNKK